VAALKLLKKLLHDSLSSSAASNLVKFFQPTHQILTKLIEAGGKGGEKMVNAFV
jgi:hypothetical protein